MNKSAIFFQKAINVKNAWLEAKVVCHSWRLTLYSQPRAKGRRITNMRINLSYDLPTGVTPFSFISMVMHSANVAYLYVVDNKCCNYVYRKADLYRASHHFEPTDVHDVLDTLLKRAIERDKETAYYAFDIDGIIWDAHRLVDDIHKEIYQLFRFFTDEQLKRISRELLGSSKHFGSDTIKTLQLIKRISNYNDKIGEAVEIIEKFNKDFEAKHENYMCPNGFSANSFLDSPVSYKAVLNFIEAARKGSIELYNELKTKEQL